MGNTITRWLTEEYGSTTAPLCDFERIRYEVRPGDVLLIEGHTRISDVIKTITQSPWSHSALYLGRIHDIDAPELRERIRKVHHGDADEQLVLEALLGEGTVINTLDKYREYHVRICRPTGLSRGDAQQVIAYCLNHLGFRYDVRQLLDLARFVFPYGILPRRWRSSLFEHNAGASTRTVCSSMLAAAFNSVQFPVLPVIHRREDGSVRVYPRNARLYTPRDFDYSPYFDIIKYPFLGIDERTRYRNLPWDHKGHLLVGNGHAPIPGLDEIEEHLDSEEAGKNDQPQTTRAL
jgi:hypothetical protein